jgi:hypothetical protein
MQQQTAMLENDKQFVIGYFNDSAQAFASEDQGRRMTRNRVAQRQKFKRMQISKSASVNLEDSKLLNMFDLIKSTCLYDSSHNSY